MSYGALLSSGLQSRVRILKGIAVLIALTTAVGMILKYRSAYLDNQVKTDPPSSFWTAGVIKSITAPSDVILGFGQDWSSEIPYYAERRAVLYYAKDVPGKREALHWAYQTVADEHLHWGALFICGDSGRSIHDFDLPSSAHFSETPTANLSDCKIYKGQ